MRNCAETGTFYPCRAKCARFGKNRRRGKGSWQRLAALPPDVRKAYGFPRNLFLPPERGHPVRQRAQHASASPQSSKLRTVVRTSRSGGQHDTPAGLPRRGPRDVRAPRPSLSGHQAAQAAHPARAERREDFVTANPGARNNGHSRQRKLLACVLSMCAN